jgi:hypothetical protein
MENSRFALSALVSPALLAAAAISVLAQQGSTEPSKPTPFVFSPANTIIYVSDFELDSETFQADQSMRRAHPRPHVVNGPLRQSKDPATQAQKLVNLMATDIVQNLTKAGYKAQRLAAADVRPSEGVWVHGVFTELNEGNRMQRAVIGFGTGERGNFGCRRRADRRPEAAANLARSPGDPPLRRLHLRRLPR